MGSEMCIRDSYAPLLAALSHTGTSIVPEAAVTAQGDAFWENPIGTGPMQFVEWVPNDHYSLNRFDDYFKGPGKTTSLTLRIMPEGGARTIALETGEIDMSISVDATDVQNVKANKELMALEKTSVSVEYLAMNCEKEPFNDPKVRQAKFRVACDVSNPLCGPHGAAYVFGPQKGAKPKDLPLLDEALRRFSQVVKQDLGKDILDTPGSGAAGGMGAGLMAFFDAQLVPGFQIVNEGVGFEALLQKLRPDVVITGEGRMDAQSVMGKLPVEVAKVAKKYGARVVAVGSQQDMLRMVRAMLDNGDWLHEEEEYAPPETLQRRLEQVARHARWEGGEFCGFLAEMISPNPYGELIPERSRFHVACGRRCSPWTARTPSSPRTGSSSMSAAAACPFSPSMRMRTLPWTRAG